MADSKRVIEFLRDARQGGLGHLQAGGAVTEEVSQMAAEYAALCAQTNERLRQCSALLQQGLRSEAIHQAEQTPNLLDLISQLDLPDPQIWAEFCQNNGLPVPPPLQFDRASQLNDAYAQEQPLEHLLAQHRLLALSRAPIRERLYVMRKIAQVDAGSSHWNKDLRDFEIARQKELPAAFHTAVKNHDDKAIVALMDEINRQPWQEPPPVDLATAVAEAYARLQRTAVEADLQKLVEPLRDAFAARSLQECQALVQRWKNVMASAGVANVSPELMDEIKPVAAFVAEQTKRDDHVKRFNDACRAFTKLLDSDAPDAQLEAGYAKLKEYKEEVPEEFIRRYVAKKASRRKDVERKHKTGLMIIGGIAAAGIVVVLIVAYLYMTGANATKWAAKINEAVAHHTKEGMDEAQANVDLLKNTHAALLNEPKVAAAVNALQAERAKYERDQQNLKALLGRLDGATQPAATMLANGDATMDELRARGEQLEGAIKEANAIAPDLAWADADQALPRAVAGATSVVKSMQERVLTVFRKELQDIVAALDAVPAAASNTDAAARAQTQLAALATRAGSLRNLPLLDDEARTSLNALAERISQRRQGAAATGDVAAELERARKSADSAGSLKAELETFDTRFPDDPHAADFKKALEEMGPAQSLEAWLQLVVTFKGSLAPTSATIAQKRASDVEAFLTAHPDLPLFAEVTAYVQYLHAASDALADKGTWQDAFSGLLANPLLTDLQVMEISNGTRYYTLGDAKRTEHRINNTVSVSFEAIDAKELTKDINKRLTINIDPPLVVADKPIPSPHAKLMVEIADELKGISDTNWDTFGVDIADRLVASSQMDLVVKAILLQQSLKTEQAVAGGQYGVADVYDRLLSDLSRQNPAEIYWFDPSRVSDGTKKALAQIIGAVPPGRTIKQKIAAGRSALFKAVAPTVLAPGLLLKDDAGVWNVFTQAPPETGATLWAIVPATTAGAATEPGKTPTSLLLVGTSVGGKFVLNETELKKLPQGSIVYAVRP